MFFVFEFRVFVVSSEWFRFIRVQGARPLRKGSVRKRVPLRISHRYGFKLEAQKAHKHKHAIGISLPYWVSF